MGSTLRHVHVRAGASAGLGFSSVGESTSEAGSAAPTDERAAASGAGVDGGADVTPGSGPAEDTDCRAPDGAPDDAEPPAPVSEATCGETEAAEGRTVGA